MVKSTRARVPLTRAVVTHAAVALADQEGVDAVSMRRLAQQLGVVPMALYKHVADKEDLLDGMVDVVIEAYAVESPGSDDWRDGVRARVLAARRSLLEHPWARRAIETRTVRSAAVLRHMEALTSTLLDAGISADLAHHAMHALGNRIWGFSPELFNDPAAPEPTRKVRAQVEPTAYPAIMAVATDARQRRPGASGCDEDFEFGFALDLILDGVERLRREGWRS